MVFKEVKKVAYSVAFVFYVVLLIKHHCMAIETIIVTNENELPNSIKNTIVYIKFKDDPYQITDNLDISNNSMLIIEPGVIIKFISASKADIFIRNNSAIIVNGTSTDKVFIHSLNNLIVLENSTGQINFCELEYKKSIQIRDSNFKINNSKLIDQYKLFSIDGSLVSMNNFISDSRIDIKYSDFFMENALFNSGSEIKLKYSRAAIKNLINSYPYSYIYLYGSHSTSIVNSSLGYLSNYIPYNENDIYEFTNENYKFDSSSDWSKQNFLSLTDCKINGLLFDTKDSKNLKLNITSSYFDNYFNIKALRELSIENSTIRPAFSYSIFSSVLNLNRNTFLSSFTLNLDDQNSSSSSVYINQNNFKSSSLIECLKKSNVNGVFEMKRNKFENVLYFNKCFNMTLRENSFLSQDSCLIKSSPFIFDYKEESLIQNDARYNYWNTNDFYIAQTKNCLFYENLLLNEFLLWPITNSSYHQILINQTNNEDSFILSKNQLKCGFLRNDLVLTKNLIQTNNSTKYYANYNIIVMPNVTLTLMPGIIISFAQNRGLIVLGNLIANGSSEEIQLAYDGESYFKWSGIDFKGHNFSHMYQSKSILENVSINNCNLLNVENTTKLEMKKIRSTNLNNLIIKTNYDFVLEEFRQEETDYGSLFSLETTSSNASIILTDSNIFFNGRFSVITINKSLIIKNSYIEAYSVYLKNSCLKNDSKCQFNVINSSLESKQSGINFLSNSDLNILNSNLTFNLYGGWYGDNYFKISKPNQNQLKDYNFLNFYLIDSMLYANDVLFKTDNHISLNIIINSTKINTDLNNLQLFETYNQLNTIKLFMYKCHLNTINIDFNVYDTTKFYLNFIENSFMGDNKSVISIRGQFKELIIKKNIFMNYLFSENFLRIFLKNYYDTNVEYMNIDISDNYFSNMKTNCLIFLDNNYQVQKLNSSLLDFKIYNNRFKNIKNYVIGTNMNNKQFDSSTKMLINASLNYWQTNFSLIINNNYLYNKYTNDLVGINVLPFYQDENLNVLNNDSSDGLFDSDSSSFIGGTLHNKNVRLMPTRIYTVIADIYIPINHTLTLEAGVIINFLDRFHIYCSGNLIVNGNQTHLVVINLNTTNKENEEPFNLIEFKEESNLYGLSSLNYLSLNIYEFISGSVLLISTKNFSPKLNNIIISNKYNYEEINNLYYKENYGILLNNGNSTTQTLNINNISIFGFLNCFVVSFKIRLTEIIDSKFKNCIKYGVNVNSNELIVKSSFFTYDMSTQFQGQQFNFLLSGTLNKLTIQDSKFFSSTMPSITKSVLTINSLESLIEKNSFVNVFVEFFQGGTNNKVLFIQNEYMFDFKLDESKIFSHYRYYYFDSCIEWTFENNTFSLNNSADLINLNLINSNSLCSNKSLLTINRNRLILKGDKFMNKNLRFFYINGYDGYINVVVNENTFIFPNDFNATNVNFPLIYIKSLTNITINQNAFMFSNYNFSSRDELRCPFQIVSKIPYALNGKYNYFGEKTSFILSECDHTSDSESYIDYYPFINYNKTVIDLDLERLYFPSYSIFTGGMIRNNLTIQSYNDSLPCQYTVLKNILIPNNVEVTIKPNCILKFKYNKRILLYGKLIGIGTESMPISFISENSTYWAGIYVNALNSIFDYKYLIIQNIIDNSYALTYTQYNGILSIENLIITYASNGIKLLAGNLDTIKIISSKMNLTKYSYYSQTNLFTFYISTSSTNLYIQNSTFSNFDLNGFTFKTLFLNNSYFYSIQNIQFYIDCDYFYMKSNYFNVRNFRINFYLKSCNLINSREFSIENNHFNGYDKTDINILNLDFSNYYNYDYPNPASFILRENNFFNYALQINNARSLEFFNTLIISNVFESINALKNVYWYEDNYQVMKLNIMQRCALLNNTIKNSTYRYGILLKLTNNLKKISIKNNLFVDNDPYLASNSLPSINLYISTSSFVEINQNIFTRSNKLDYDVGFGEQNLRRTNLTFNYWNGLNSSEDVLQRIFNPKSENAIIYEPFLTKASLNILNDTRRDLLDEFNCSSFSFCLNNGLCVGDNVCKCFNGYKGLNCSQYDCLNNCSNHGRCVDANVCSCGQGYFGNDCSIFTCQENCNNNGKCIELNKCQCNSGWSGKYCSEITCLYDCNQHGLCIGPNTCECNSSYTGKYCEMPVCSNFCSYKGKCIAPNKCKCNTGWSDEFNCEKCAYKFYGPDCQPITIIFSASPLIIESRTTGGVKIRGHNIYYGSQAYKCLFIDSNTNASISLVGQIVDDELLLCSFSDILFDTFPIGELNLRVHKGATIMFETRFRIFNNCTILSCGEREIPKRGYCRYGTCSCLQYYEGKDCEKLIYKPQFLTVNTSFLVKEFSEFKLNLLLNSSSTQPIELKLVKYPPNVELVNNSMVYWNSVSSNEKANEFIITATNRAGSDTLKFYLIIKPAYFVELSNLVFKEYPYPPNYIFINGTIKDVDNSSIIVRGNRQVVLKLIRTVFDGTSKESSKVKSDIFINLLTLINGRFTYVHYPYYKDFGNFSIGGFHPFEKYSIMNDQIVNEWNILGLVINETVLNFNGYKEDKFEKVFYLRNPNYRLLTNLTWSYMRSEYFELKLFYNNQSIRDKEEIVKKVFDENEVIYLKIVFLPKIELNGEINLSFLTNENVREQLKIFVDLKTRVPIVSCIPTAFEFQILNGTFKVFDLKIKNSGDLDAEMLRLQFIYSIENEYTNSFQFQETTDISFLNNSIFLKRLNVGETKTLFFSITTNSKQSEGFYKTNLRISNKFISYIIEITYFLTNLNNVQLTVITENEFTYFTEEKPLLANASITLVNRLANYKNTLKTDSSGMITFSNLTENYYEVYAEAQKHTSRYLIWQPKSSKNYLSIFLSRQTVTITWSVIPKLYEDKYEISLVADFETEVYAPVVVVEPLYIDILQFEFNNYFIIKVTNYGFIRANNLTINLPDEFRNYRFQFSEKYEKFNLEANTSVKIRVNVYQINSIEMVRKKRDTNRIVCTSGISIGYDFICGGVQVYNSISIHLDGKCMSVPEIWSNAPTDGSRVVINGIGNGIGDSSCDIECSRPRQNQGGFFSSCDPCVTKTVLCSLTSISCASSKRRFCAGLAQCLIDAVRICGGLGSGGSGVGGGGSSGGGGASGSWKKAMMVSTIKYKEDIGPYIVFVQLAILNEENIEKETYGDLIWMNKEAKDWLKINFELYLTDLSDSGRYISEKELKLLLNSSFFSINATEIQMRNLIERFNNTQILNDDDDDKVYNSSNKMNMTLLNELNAKHESYLNLAKSNGFEDFNSWLSSLLKEFDNAPNKKTICAKIKLLIQQTLVLTREGFEAKLELNNQELIQLRNISVRLNIFSNDSLSKSNHLFSIGNPAYSNMENKTDTLNLESKQIGTITWFLIPYKEAAEKIETSYSVGGSLEYYLEDKKVIYDLAPETIQVRPEARLELIYFLEKKVIGDDPLTKEIEPSIPFSLGLLLYNKGYGIAKNLQIISFEPKIIENVKGLLIDFKLQKTAYLNNVPIDNSLKLNFGDIQPFQLKHALWKFNSTLKGEFSNLTVSFTNTNPNGDKKLSLIEKIEYKELVRLVKIDRPIELNDNLPDFLVIDNEFLYLKGLKPDKVYTSNFEFDRFSVYYLNEIFTLENINQTFIEFKIAEIKPENENKLSFSPIRIKGKKIIWFYSILRINLHQKDTQSISIRKILRNNFEERPIENFWISEYDSTLSFLNIFDVLEFTNETQDVLNQTIIYNLFKKLKYSIQFNSNLTEIITTPENDILLPYFKEKNYCVSVNSSLLELNRLIADINGSVIYPNLRDGSLVLFKLSPSFSSSNNYYYIDKTNGKIYSNISSTQINQHKSEIVKKIFKFNLTIELRDEINLISNYSLGYNGNFSYAYLEIRIDLDCDNNDDKGNDKKVLNLWKTVLDTFLKYFRRIVDFLIHLFE